MNTYCCQLHSPLVQVAVAILSTTELVFALIVGIRSEQHNLHGRNKPNK